MNPRICKFAAASLVALLTLGFMARVRAADLSATNRLQQRYKIALADLMILKRQKLGAFQLTKEIGADGVEVDMGGLGERETWDNQLTNAATRQQFLDKA